MEASVAKDLVDTLKRTIDQLSSSQAQLASQLGKSTNRSMDDYERSKQQWESEKRDLNNAINRLEKDLTAKIPESATLAKKIAALEVDKF
jgi:prefoldin subunit 5